MSVNVARGFEEFERGSELVPHPNARKSGAEKLSGIPFGVWSQRVVLSYMALRKTIFRAPGIGGARSNYLGSIQFSS
jgi:hypothetical protein